MKRKIIFTVVLGLALVGLMADPSFARRFVPAFQVMDASGVSMSSYAISGSTVITTTPIETQQNVGFNTLVVDFSGGGGASIAYEVSTDNSNWYTPYTTDGSTTTSAGTVVTNLSATRWIIFTARLSNYIRFKVTPVASGTISLKYILQEQQE